MTDGIIQRTMKHVRARLMKEGSGHDWFHTERVWKLAQFLQSKEGGNRELIEVAALLHCAAEHDFRNKQDEQVRTYALEGILDVLDIKEEWHNDIIAIAHWCRFKGKDTERATSLEGKIVQDANFLDTLGAIGVARGFAAGGYLGRVIHNPEIKPALHSSKDAYMKRKKEGTSVNYIYEKPLQLMPLINTATAKQIAKRRLEYTAQFMVEFEKEWNLDDVGEMEDELKSVSA